MRPSATALLLSLLHLLPFVSSQTILTGPSAAGLPTCAQNCITLQTAANGCIPPAAPITNQATYDDCFCNSNFLTTLKASPIGICDAECPVATDRQQVQAWFVNLCSAGIASAYSDVAASATASAAASTAVAPPVIIPPVANTAPPPAPNTLVTTASSNPTSSSAFTLGTSGATNSLGGTVAPVTGTWWDNHKQWIAMVIVLIIAFTLIIIGGVLWKRRYTRRRNSVTPYGAPVAWGPHQNQAAASSGILAEKGKGKANAGMEEERGGKLKKFMRRG